MNSTNSTLTPWKRPECYVGASWPGYLIAPVGRNRDSSILQNSNWDAQWATLTPLVADVPGEDCASPCIVSENHWAVGWVEWVAIHESNGPAIEAAEKLASTLDDYPILDDDDNSRREWDAYWEGWDKWGGFMDFIRLLKDAFDLRDSTVWVMEDFDRDATLSFFESLIPSGAFYIPEGDGVSIQGRYAVQNLTRKGDCREILAKFLREQRNAQKTATLNA